MCDCYYYYDCYYHTVYSAILSILAERDGSSSKIKMRLFFAVSVRPKEARARPIAEKTRQWFTIGPIDRPIDRWLQINILVYRLRWPVLLYYFILHAEYACGLTTCPFITATYYRCVLLLLVVIVVVVHCCWWFVYYILHHYFDVFFFICHFSLRFQFNCYYIAIWLYLVVEKVCSKHSLSIRILCPLQFLFAHCVNLDEILLFEQWHRKYNQKIWPTRKQNEKKINNWKWTAKIT